MNLYRANAIVAMAAMAVAAPLMAHDRGAPALQATALPAAARPAAAIVDAFHAALRRGDTNAAEAHLAVNALIYESGGVERGRQEYASHHLGADAAFAQAVPSTITRRAGEAVGNVAWIATEGRTAGAYKGRALDLVTTETMVLRRVGKGWKIVHIHWSSAEGEK